MSCLQDPGAGGRLQRKTSRYPSGQAGTQAGGTQYSEQNPGRTCRNPPSTQEFVYGAVQQNRKSVSRVAEWQPPRPQQTQQTHMEAETI